MTVFYCNQESFEGCPYRIIDLEKPFPICNYAKEQAKLIVSREFSEIPRLTSRTCDWIKMEEGRLDALRILHRERFMDFLDNVQIGDKVYSEIGPFHDVTLLEKPSNDSEFVRCETSEGKIIKIQAAHLGRVAKGNYSGEFFIKGIENETKALFSENRAKYNGFRTVIERKKDGFLLKVLGDSQEQVDDFIFMVLEQNLELMRFLAGPRRPIH